MENKRKSISKKLRFEVFKRDNFTCQYCGNMAPDVILEVDHINPVAEKGTNDIMNLITSCFNCNRGKGCKTLSDNQVITQQQNQLKEINERREQLKLMLKWKKELTKFDDEQINIINDMLSKHSNQCFSDYGRQCMLKTIKKYGIIEAIESTKLSIEQYYDENDENIEKIIDYIPRICARRLEQKDKPFLSKIFYIKAILRNRFGVYNDERIMYCLTNLIKIKLDYDIICGFSKTARSWTMFWKLLNDYYGGDW